MRLRYLHYFVVEKSVHDDWFGFMYHRWCINHTKGNNIRNALLCISIVVIHYDWSTPLYNERSTPLQVFTRAFFSSWTLPWMRLTFIQKCVFVQTKQNWVFSRAHTHSFRCTSRRIQPETSVNSCMFIKVRNIEYRFHIRSNKILM